MSSAKPYEGQRIEPERAAALGQLHMRIGEALDDGETIPCIHDPDPDLWLSEHRSDQVEAADRCVSCPVMLACRDYVLKFPEHTVMGGELPTSIQKVRSK